MHGGDCYRNSVKIDFSININPLGVSAEVKHALIRSVDAVSQYPDPDSAVLKNLLAEKLGIEEKNLVLGNGASELMMAVMHAIKPKRVLLAVPSFTGYGHVLEAVAAEAVYHYLKKEDDFRLTETFLDKIRNNTDLIVLTNPNNPTGRYIDRELLECILYKAERADAAVLIDECFMELSDEPSRSLIEKAKLPGKAMILRAFTKSFAIPGVRLGYMVSGDKALIESIQRQLPEWNISVQAGYAGEAALRSTDSLEKAGSLIRKERAYLKRSLEAMDFEVCGSDTCFLLIRYDMENDLYEELLKEGILIRKCDDYRGLDGSWYRIAVRKHEDNSILIDTIGKIIAG